MLCVSATFLSCFPLTLAPPTHTPSAQHDVSALVEGCSAQTDLKGLLLFPLKHFLVQEVPEFPSYLKVYYTITVY